MGRAVRYQEMLRRLAIVDEGFVGDQAGLVLGPDGVRALDSKTVALVRVGVLAAIGAPEVRRPRRHRLLLPPSLFEQPAAELSGDDSVQLSEDRWQPDHIA